MTTSTIGIIGGSGFVGSVLANRLVTLGYRVRILSRDREHARGLWLLPGTDIVVTNAHEQDQLNHAVAGCNVLINLVGILNERGDSGAGFHRAHADVALNAARACKSNDIARLLHMSALNADTASASHYLRSKGEAEKLLLAEHGKRLAVTIMRPSVIFGPHDRFLNRFASLLAMTPGIFPLACAEARFQPVYVGDVAEAFVKALADRASEGQRYELGGPRVLSLAEVVAYVAHLRGLHRRILRLGPGLSKLQAHLMEHIPGKPFSLDNLRSMQTDSICQHGNGLEMLGITPTPMEIIVPQYLGGKRIRNRYDAFRESAAR